MRCVQRGHDPGHRFRGSRQCALGLDFFPGPRPSVRRLRRLCSLSQSWWRPDRASPTSCPSMSQCSPTDGGDLMNYEGTEFTATAATRAAIVALMVLVAEIGSPSLAAADQVVFPAGTACEFELRVDIGESGQVTKEFRDKNDNLVGLLSAGRGATLVFTNDDTGATLSLKANGSVTRTTFNPDGSST